MLHVTDEYWTLPLADLPVLQTDDFPTYYLDWLDHPTHDEYWKRWDIDSDYSRITVPSLHFSGWYDGFARHRRQLRGHERHRCARPAADDLAVDARAVDAGVGLGGVEPRVPERRRGASGLVRPPPQGNRVGRSPGACLHPARGLARLHQLAPRADDADRAVPPLCRRRQLCARRRHALGRAAAARAPRRVHLRPRSAHVERRRPLLLRRLRDADGPGLPGCGRGEQVGAGVHLGGAARGSDADRRRRAGAARLLQRHRH